MSDYKPTSLPPPAGTARYWRAAEFAQHCYDNPGQWFKYGTGNPGRAHYLKTRYKLEACSRHPHPDKNQADIYARWNQEGTA